MRKLEFIKDRAVTLRGSVKTSYRTSIYTDASYPSPAGILHIIPNGQHFGVHLARERVELFSSAGKNHIAGLNNLANAKLFCLYCADYIAQLLGDLQRGVLGTTGTSQTLVGVFSRDVISSARLCRSYHIGITIPEVEYHTQVYAGSFALATLVNSEDEEPEHLPQFSKAFSDQKCIDVGDGEGWMRPYVAFTNRMTPLAYNIWLEPEYAIDYMEVK